MKCYKMSFRNPLWYDQSNFDFDTQIGRKSQFDCNLKNSWDKKFKEARFRYNFKEIERKTLDGKFRFVVELNINRAISKREPNFVSSMKMPFDQEHFNFLQVEDDEHLFKIKPRHWEECEMDFYEHILMINTSPIGYCSSLIVPRIKKCYPQILNSDALRLAIEIVLISHDPFLRVGMNSLGGYSSVNHLHFHLYILEETSYLQSAPVKHIISKCHELTDYPAHGFAFEVTKKSRILSVVKSVMKLIQYLLEKEIAYNLLIIRGTSFYNAEGDIKISESAEFLENIRIYIWVRKPVFGSKRNDEFNPAVCELAGHILAKDDQFFGNVTEADIINMLKDICQETYLEVRGKIMNLYN